jgi:hypothetical protein
VSSQNQEIPTLDDLIGMVYTKWSDLHPRTKLTDATGKRIRMAAEDAYLQLEGFIQGGLTVTEAMIEIRDTMYPEDLMK